MLRLPTSRPRSSEPSFNSSAGLSDLGTQSRGAGRLQHFGVRETHQVSSDRAGRRLRDRRHWQQTKRIRTGTEQQSSSRVTLNPGTLAGHWTAPICKDPPSFPIQLGADETSKFVLTTTDLKIGSGYLAISPQPGFDPRDIVVSFFYNFLSGGILADSTGTAAFRSSSKICLSRRVPIRGFGNQHRSGLGSLPGDRCFRCQSATAGQ